MIAPYQFNWRLKVIIRAAVDLDIHYTKEEPTCYIEVFKYIL